nr:uncharacterized protein LOC109767769 [Aegilops tauschii subsp. strangulata]
MNQVVSAALVAQRETDEEAAAAAVPSGGETEPVVVGSDIDQEKVEQVSEASSKTAARKKVVQRPVYFVSSLLQRARSRALVEFIEEWTPTPDEEVQETVIPGKEAPQEWIMYFDGAFSLQGAKAGVLLVAPTGEHLKYVVQMHFPREKATNNTAEYEGLLVGLRIAVELGIKKLIIRGDSQLVVREVNKDY